MIEFGIVCPISPVTGPSIRVFTWDSIREFAEKAEELGLDCIWVMDNLKGYYPECWTTLAAIGTITKKIKLGSSVLNMAARLPGILAKTASTLDYYSNGRLVLGLGAGSRYRYEYTEYGIPWKSLPLRVAMMKEAIEIIKKMWTQDSVNYQGKFYRIENASLRPKPRNGIPIWIGGMSESILRVTGEVGDAWIPHDIEPHELNKKFNRIKKYAEEAGRDPFKITPALYSHVSLSSSDKEAEARVKRLLELQPREHRRFFNMLGSESCIEWIAKYVDVGVEHFALSFVTSSPEDAIENLNLFVSEVVSYFR